jgi:hypothetical protein
MTLEITKDSKNPFNKTVKKKHCMAFTAPDATKTTTLYECKSTAINGDRIMIEAKQKKIWFQIIKLIKTNLLW